MQIAHTHSFPSLPAGLDAVVDLVDAAVDVVYFVVAVVTVRVSLSHCIVHSGFYT